MKKYIITILISLGFCNTLFATSLSDGFIQTSSKKRTTTNTNRSIPKTIVYKTESQAATAAAKLGYSKISERTSYGAAIYKKGNSYISRDMDGHNGGAWKEASSPSKLNSKTTRNGTFDVNLKRIGD